MNFSLKWKLKVLKSFKVKREKLINVNILNKKYKNLLDIWIVGIICRRNENVYLVWIW